MIRNALLILLTLAVAICGGAASVAFVLEHDIKVGSLRVGPWTAYPSSGSPDADPYSLAEAAADGALSLGRSEGIIFSTGEDSAGNDLRSECTYELTGETPFARFWTLRTEPYDYADAVRVKNPPSHGALHSRSLIRGADNSLAVTIGPSAAPGNWMRTTGTGRIRLVLTTYDAPIRGGPMAETVVMPSIKRISCDG
ncbi:MAG: DUF1214 domain-containing protein [Rhizobiaceae bacterium]|nr:DUF1214 domain-containing protein [Rhizobiaceae bacterium]